MNKTLLSLAAVLLAGISLAHAVGEADLTPEEQWAIAQKAVTLPERAAWKLEYARTDDKSIAYHPVIVESARIGTTQRDVVQWDNGKTTESWWLGPDVFAQSAITTGLIYGPNRWPKDRFPLAAWISPASLKGWDSADGTKVLVFKSHLRLKQSSPGIFTPDEGAEAGPGLDLVAYVDPKAGKVVRVDIDGRAVKVTWLPAFAALPEPPEAIARMQDKFLKMRHRLSNGE